MSAAETGARVADLPDALCQTVKDIAEPGTREDHGGPPTLDAGADGLGIEGLASVVARVRACPHPGFLARPVWPADAYGVIGAENKAGKTWLSLDLAVAKAGGTAWLGQFPIDEQGPVLLFLGEGGERKMVRRLEAIARFHGVGPASLPIRLAHRVPHLNDEEHLTAVGRELEAHPADLVVLDPLYLAARGANGASLYDMGGHLETIQRLCQKAAAALVVVHHWNKTGTGKGRERFSGTGPAEWGRVTVSMSVDKRTTDGDASVVELTARFVGDEIPDVEHSFVRRVAVDDPEDLASPMHYSVAPVEKATQPVWDRDAAVRTAVLEVLEAHPDGAFSIREVTDLIKASGGKGKGFRREDVGTILHELASQGIVSAEPGPRNATLFQHCHRNPGSDASGVAPTGPHL